MSTIQDVGAILAIVLTGIGVLFALAKMFSAGSRLARRVYDFLDQWNGEPAHGGEPAKPGVPERLAALERVQQATKTTVEQVKGELEHNGGGTTRDAIARIEGHLGTGPDTGEVGKK